MRSTDSACKFVRNSSESPKRTSPNLVLWKALIGLRGYITGHADKTQTQSNRCHCIWAVSLLSAADVHLIGGDSQTLEEQDRALLAARLRYVRSVVEYLHSHPLSHF